MTNLPARIVVEGEIVGDITDHFSTGHGRCSWCEVNTWAAYARAPRQDDLCPELPVWYVEVQNEVRTSLARLCDVHKERVERTTGFVSARLLTGQSP